LVAMQSQRFPIPTARASTLVLTKNAGTLWMQDPLRNQCFNPLAGLKGRIQLNQRLWPEDASVQVLLSILADPSVTNLYETINVGSVVVDDLIAEPENIHRALRWEVRRRHHCGLSEGCCRQLIGAFRHAVVVVTPRLKLCTTTRGRLVSTSSGVVERVS